MYLVSYEEYGKETKNLVVGMTLSAAQYYVGIHEEIDPFDHSIWEEDPEDSNRLLFVLGDSQYVIEPIKSIS